MRIKIIKKVKETIKDLICPPATQDLELNTKNRDAAIESDHIQYGPMNLEDEAYWDKLADHWKTTPEVAKESNCSNCAAFDISPRMKECMPGSVQEDGELGYCWMHHFKCHSARTCYTWAAGGPITEDKVSEEWQEKNMDKLEEKDDRCTRIAKRKYDVWPSAYASGAVVKCRKGKIWKGLKESGVISEETEESLIKKITKILRDEGGAAGMDALTKGADAPKKDIEDAIEDEEKFVVHTDGDIILRDKSIIEIIKKIDGKYVVYPKSGGDRLGTHDTEEGAKKQLAAIEISKQQNEEKKKAGTESSKESSLRDWFGRKGAKGKSSGWVDCNTCRKDKKTGRKTCKSCGRQKGEKRSKYPACRPTPGACGEKGRGKSWGKKSEGLEEDLQVYTEIHIGDATFDDGTLVEDLGFWDDDLMEAYYQGRKVTLNKPTRGDVKKFKVYVNSGKKDSKGRIKAKKVNFGDKKMKIKKSNPKRRKSFRARHNCDNPGPKTKARYWSCKKW